MAASTRLEFANSVAFFANVGIMQFTQRQRIFEGIGRPLGAAILVGLLLGFAGPFGSNPAYPRATRYAFWLGLSVAGMLFALAADAIVPEDKPQARWRRLVVAALLSAVPMTFVVAWTMSFLQPGRVFAPGQLPSLFVAVLAVQLLMAYVAMVTRHAPKQATRDPATGDETPVRFPAALLGKLDSAIGREIVAIETEDHYLRVHTSGGSGLILMRMADAVALIDPRLGMQVHRRWWVAESAVGGLQTDGQRPALRLTDGRIVPVGRTFAAAVRARFAGT